VAMFDVEIECIFWIIVNFK